MMLRFFILAWLWLGVSFALMWWVQRSVDDLHRGAAEAVGRAMQAGEAVVIEGEATPFPRPQIGKTPNAAGPEDLARLEFDRRELMRRLRTLWISVTLVPLLIAGWYVARLQTRVRELEAGVGSQVEDSPGRRSGVSQYNPPDPSSP